MSPNDADGIANSVDPDQIAHLGAVWCGSALFAKAYLSENLGSLRYKTFLNRQFGNLCRVHPTKVSIPNTALWVEICTPQPRLFTSVIFEHRQDGVLWI